jgi:hypothetical protein
LLVYQNLTSSGIFLLLPFCSRDWTQGLTW